MVKQMNKLDTLYNEGKKLMEQAIDCYSKNKITEAEEYRKKANELYNKADIEGMKFILDYCISAYCKKENIPLEKNNSCCDKKSLYDFFFAHVALFFVG